MAFILEQRRQKMNWTPLLHVIAFSFLGSCFASILEFAATARSGLGLFFAEIPFIELLLNIKINWPAVCAGIGVYYKNSTKINKDVKKFLKWTEKTTNFLVDKIIDKLTRNKKD